MFGMLREIKQSVTSVTLRDKALYLSRRTRALRDVTPPYKGV